MEITALTALELGKKIKAGEVTVEEAVKAQLEKIKERDGVYNCYVTVMEEEALKRAKEVQKRIDAGELDDSPLAGVPVAIKDNICTKGVLTTCSSKILNNFKPPYDAAVIEKLEAAGAVIIGKVNMDEFANGRYNRDLLFWTYKEPMEYGACTGRFIRRCGSSSRRGGSMVCSWI